MGGLISAWNQDFEEMQEEKHSMVLKIVLKEKASGISFAIYNAYGPYQDRKGFWEAFFKSILMETRNVIIEGDLNLTLSKKENWGILSRKDGMSSYFANLFESKELVDIQPLKLTPTWRNNKSGDHTISKRLYKFLLSENFLLRS